MEKKYERNRNELANSVLSTYSTQLRKVMNTMPVKQLTPSFDPNNTFSKFKMQHKKRQSADIGNKTFFKGATSFVLQAQASVMIQKNDQTIKSVLGIDGRKSGG